MPLDQPPRPGGVPGGQRVRYRIAGETMLLMPGGRSAVQRRDPAGLFGLQPGAEQVGEQLVITPPAAHLIQRQQEQAGLLDRLQHRLAAGPAGDRIAQLPGQPLQHRGFQQEGAHLLALPLEHLLGQEVQHVAVGAGERCHEPGNIGLPAQRQGGQLQPGRPSLGAVCQRGHGRIGQVSTGGFAEHGGSLFGGAPQVGGAQLGELPAGPQPG